MYYYTIPLVSVTRSHPPNPAADAAGLGGFDRLHPPPLSLTL